MELSYILKDAIQFDPGNIGEFLIEKLNPKDYSLYNATYENGKVVQMNSEVMGWYRIKSPGAFVNCGEVVFQIDLCSWWGIIKPIPEIDEMTIAKIEIELINENVEALNTYKEELLNRLRAYNLSILK
jgi:hypothetical protein